MKSKILIIDDEVNILSIVSETLENENYVIQTCRSAIEAIDTTNTFQPDIIILDLKMPLMNGTEFLEALKKGKHQDFSVIILTGHGSEPDMKTCFDLGCYAFLRKPVSMVELRGTVHNLSLLESFKRELTNKNETLEKQVKERTIELESKVQTLKEVLNHLEEEKIAIRRDIIQKVKKYILPLVKELKYSEGKHQRQLIRLIEDSLKKYISSPNNYLDIISLLTPREIQIADLIREGYKSKDIAQKLGISKGTVEKHRQQVRKKLNISNESVNLTTFLIEKLD